jgi:1-acyl-sn-glycerol-3-phosphate acyltransferase
MRLRPEEQLGDVPNPLLYNVAIKSIVMGYLRAHGGMRVLGAENFPAEGACLVTPVHRSMSDIPAVGLAAYRATGRRLHYIGKQELWELPVVPRAFAACGGIPLDREQTLAGQPFVTRAQIHSVITGGGAITMFPEGTRRSGPEVQRKHLHRGVAQLAMRYGVPMVPVGIAGTEKGLRGPITVAIGPPVQVEQETGQPTGTKGFVAAARLVLNDLHAALGEQQHIAHGAG